MTVQDKKLADQAARITALTALDRSLIVESGAGSGKTALMAGRVAMLLAAGRQPKEIAAVTFTELAASELLLRVRDFVDDLLDGTVPVELAAAVPDGLTDSQAANLKVARTSRNGPSSRPVAGRHWRRPYPSKEASMIG